MRPLYYNKEIQRPSNVETATTIPMTDELERAYYIGLHPLANDERVIKVDGVHTRQRVALDIDGNKYTHYLATPDAGLVYQPDLDKIDADALLKAEVSAKVARDKALDELTIENNTVFYDANNKAIGNMSAVVSLANWKFNQSLLVTNNHVDSYQLIYKDTLVTWKGADNAPHTVMIESICEALETSMTNVSTILGL